MNTSAVHYILMHHLYSVLVIKVYFDHIGCTVTSEVCHRLETLPG